MKEGNDIRNASNFTDSQPQPLKFRVSTSVDLNGHLASGDESVTKKATELKKPQKRQNSPSLVNLNQK